MDSWGDMHEELKIEDVTPMSKVEEYIIQLNKEMKATIVTHREKKKIVEDYVPKMLFEHNYRFLGIDGEGNYQPLHSWYSQDGLYKNGVAS